MPRFDRNHPEPVDLLLRDRGATGDKRTVDVAVERLFARYREELHVHALRLVRSPDLADDAVQEAFSKTLLAARRGARIDHAARWLHTSVRNACLDYLRQEKAVSLGEAEEISAAPLTADTVDAREGVAAIARAIRQLPEHLRAALILTDIHGLSYQEVAECMERSVDSVRQLISRARRHVREMTAGGGLALMPAARAWMSSLTERLLGGLAQTAAPVGGALLVTVAVAAQVELKRDVPVAGVHSSGAIHHTRGRLTERHVARDAAGRGSPSGRNRSVARNRPPILDPSREVSQRAEVRTRAVAAPPRVNRSGARAGVDRQRGFAGMAASKREERGPGPDPGTPEPDPGSPEPDPPVEARRRMGRPLPPEPGDSRFAERIPGGDDGVSSAGYQAVEVVGRRRAQDPLAARAIAVRASIDDAFSHFSATSASVD